MAYKGRPNNGSKSKNKSRKPNAAAAGGSLAAGESSRVSTGDAAATPAAQPGNDVSWYTRYPNLVAAAGTFPYPYRPGMQLQGGQIGGTPVRALIPGVMVLNWAPTVGYSNSPTDPASILGKEMYSRVRAAYSGTLRADAPDYVIYVMALDSIFSYIAWLKRLYRTMNVWSSENYVVPDTVLYAMGLTDPDIANLRKERTKLWQLINQLVQAELQAEQRQQEIDLQSQVAQYNREHEIWRAQETERHNWQTEQTAKRDLRERERHNKEVERETAANNLNQTIARWGTSIMDNASRNFSTIMGGASKLIGLMGGF